MSNAVTAALVLARAALATVMVLGCGGKPADTTPIAPAPAPAADTSGEMVPPEKMDEINHDLERKRPIMAHCLALAVDNRELPKNSAGKVALEIVISPSGKTDDVKVIPATSTLDSKQLSECLIQHIKEIQFPELPRPYETSFTYRFEAM